MHKLTTAASTIAAICLTTAPTCADKQVVKLTRSVLKSEMEAKALGEYGSSMGTGKERPTCSDEPNLQWPQFHSKSPLYLTLNVGVADEAHPGAIRQAELPMAFDQSADAKGDYDVLYVDLNRDGKFGEGERIVGHRPTDAGPPYDKEIDFGVIAIPTGRPNGDTVYMALMLNVLPDTGDACCDYCPGSVVEGEMQTPSGPRPVRIFDDSYDGSFTTYGQDTMVLGDATGLTLGRIVSINGRFSTIDLAPDASSITIAPYEGKLGKLKVELRTKAGTQATTLGGTIRNNDLTLQADPKADSIQLPEGSYPDTRWDMECEAGDLVWRASALTAPVKVVGDETTVFVVGDSLRMEVALSGSTAPGGTCEANFTIKGSSGEVYGNFTNHPKDGWRNTIITAKAIVKDASGKQVAGAARVPG